tara:strand:- start:1144 stop:1380 length:237 start_codon:yes stop_codon:yes gene_type:complete
MENISRKEREGHKYVPGTANEVEKQHVNEHETLQLLQRHALNGKHEEFFNLLTSTITEKNKQQEFILICGMKDFYYEN